MFKKILLVLSLLSITAAPLVAQQEKTKLSTHEKVVKALYTGVAVSFLVWVFTSLDDLMIYGSKGLFKVKESQSKIRDYIFEQNFTTKQLIDFFAENPDWARSLSTPKFSDLFKRRRLIPVLGFGSMIGVTAFLETEATQPSD